MAITQSQTVMVNPHLDGAKMYCLAYGKDKPVNYDKRLNEILTAKYGHEKMEFILVKREYMYTCDLEDLIALRPQDKNRADIVYSKEVEELIIRCSVGNGII